MTLTQLDVPAEPGQPAALERVSQAYSDPAWWYNLRGLGILTFAYRTSVWSQVAFLEANVSQNHLEIPVGTGTLLKLVLWWRRLRRRPIGRVIAVDYSDTMVRSAARNLARWGQVQVQQGDVAHLPFGDGEFPSVNIANGFHCFPEPDAALDELWRVTAPGGTVATNVLLYPRGPQPLRWVAQRIDTWGQRKGLLVSPFELDDILGRFRVRSWQLLRSEVRGNTVNILARKPEGLPT